MLKGSVEKEKLGEKIEIPRKGSKSSRKQSQSSRKQSKEEKIIGEKNRKQSRDIIMTMKSKSSMVEDSEEETKE